jgi:hypothetical protein
LGGDSHQWNGVSVEERFWLKVNKDGPVPECRPDLGPCWIWLRGKLKEGYGQFWNGEKTVMAHRFAYELLVGPIPEGLEPDHLCRNPSCVNPAHLEPVTPLENRRRGMNPYAMKRRQTHCINGHPFDAENTAYRPDGCRRCRACARIASQRYKEKQAKGH